MMQGVYENITDFNQSNFTAMAIDGQYVEVVAGSLYNLMGGYFFLTIYFLMFALVYTKTRSLGITSILMLAVASVAAASMPADLLAVMFIVIGFSIAALFASLFMK